MPAEKKKSRKQKVVIELHLTYEMVYDSNSKEFGATFAAYRGTINKNGTIDGMLAYVAHNVQLEGGPGLGGCFVEGVGWVSVRGLIPEKYKELYSGIDFKAQPAKPDIDIISNNYI